MSAAAASAVHCVNASHACEISACPGALADAGLGFLDCKTTKVDSAIAISTATAASFAAFGLGLDPDALPPGAWEARPPRQPAIQIRSVSSHKVAGLCSGAQSKGWEGTIDGARFMVERGVEGDHRFARQHAHHFQMAVIERAFLGTLQDHGSDGPLVQQQGHAAKTSFVRILWFETELAYFFRVIFPDQNRLARAHQVFNHHIAAKLP